MKVPKPTDLTIDTETLQKVQCPYKFKLPGSSKVRAMDVQNPFASHNLARVATSAMRSILWKYSWLRRSLLKKHHIRKTISHA